MSDKLAWLKSFDDDLKTRITKFCKKKNVSTFRRYNSTSIQLQVDENRIGDPGDVAKALAKHFCKTLFFFKKDLLHRRYIQRVQG